jgi:hypothetical protein
MKIKNLEEFIKKVRELAKKYNLEIEGAGINKDSIIKCEGSNERLFITLIKKNGTRN